jgi:murein L,D-transpeptidase YafK
MKKWTIRTIIILLLTGTLYYFFPEDKLPTDEKIDKLVVIKSKRTMDVYAGGQIIKTYKISLGRNPTGDKEFEGDKRTPEGQYKINDKNPNSGFYKNLGISYPNEKDIAEATEKKLKPGGEIKIHGIRNGLGFIGKFQRMFDWTAGCIALTDQEVEELYNSIEIGTPITILP